MSIDQRVADTLQDLNSKDHPYYQTVAKNLEDAYHVYSMAEMNLNTILEDSIQKLNSPPPEAPLPWWKKITGTT